MKNKQKKSLGFLSIVAFLMVLVGIGYTVSSVFAVSNAREILASGASNTLLSSGEAYESTMPKESFFSSVERQVAEKATSLWNEMLGTATGTSSDNPNVEDLQNTFSDEYPSTATVIGLVPRPLPLVYGDIEQAKYQDAILTLYSNGLLQEAINFHPTSAVRISDFIRVVMDAYRLQNHYDSTSLEGLTEKMYFSFNMPREVLIRINSAYEQGFLIQLALENADGDSRLEAFISPAEAKDILLAIQKKSPAIVASIPELTFASSETLRREEMAQLVVAAFGLKLNERSLPVFSDISGTPYQDAIQRLARLGIVGGVDGKYYPSANVENKDFVIMLVRSLVYRQGKPIVVDNFYYLNHLQDVSTTATYTPYLEYCLESEMCIPLLTQTPGGVSFQANRLLSRSEVIPLVSTAAQIKFDLPNALKGEHLTRGELAHLIVNMFQLEESGKLKAESSSEQNSTGSTSSTKTSTEEKADSKSRRETFQELMKIQ